MKRYLTISIVIHILLIAGLFFSTGSKSRGNTYPEIYRVNLVGAKRAAPPPKKIKSQVIRKPKKQVIKEEPKPKGVTVQKKSIKKTRKTVPPKDNNKQAPSRNKPVDKQTDESESQDNYPDFLNDIDFGSEFGGIQIDATNFQSSYYINLIFSKIRSRWSNPVKLTSVIETTIYFNVISNGAISDAFIESSSGINAFDQSALRAIITSGPLPPLPQEFTGDRIGIHLKFEYTP